MNSGDCAPLPGLDPHSLPNGNCESIWMLWNDNKPHVERVLRASFRLSQWDLEEAMSIAMLKFYEQYPKHRHKVRNLPAWLARLARNATTDHLRKEMRLQRKHEGGGLAQPREHLPEPETAAGRALPDDRPELLDLVFLGGRLSGKLRETAIAYFVRGKKYGEIAGTEQVGASTIRKRIQIVRKKLRGEFRKQARRSATAMAGPDRQFVSVTSRMLPGPPPHQNVFVQVFLHWPPSRGRQRMATLKSYLGLRRPRECSKWLELAELYLADGCWLNALECYAACYRKYPSILEVGWRAAQLHCLLGNQANAEWLCREMLACELSPARTNELEGCCAWVQCDMPAARTAWESAASCEPSNPAHLLHLFHAFIAEGRGPEARDVLDRVLAIDPHHHQAIGLLLPILHASGEHGLLRQYADALYSRGDRNAAVVKYYADFRLQEDLGPRESDGLRRLLTSALKTAPGFTGLLDTRAAYMAVMEQPLRLVRFLDSTTQSHPASPGAWKVRALWMCRLGRTREAVTAVRKARALTPRDHAVLAAAAYVAAHHGLRDLLLEVFDALVESPTEAEAAAAHPRLVLSAAIAWSMVTSDTRRAVGLAERAVTLSGGADPLVLYAHGRMLAQVGQVRPALTAFQSAWEIVRPMNGHFLLPHLRQGIFTALLECGEVSQAQSWRASVGAGAQHFGGPLRPATGPAEDGSPFKLSEIILFFARCGDSRPAFTISV
ncbi:MAG TPA: sigma factor [Candidatus Saccharimonadales bacterium]|jgi:RNA polymerase sigma factor (sigma-70 family)|nr:sigma factor [Candidatus Saccharimonadales bacterium]